MEKGTERKERQREVSGLIYCGTGGGRHWG